MSGDITEIRSAVLATISMWKNTGTGISVQDLVKKVCGTFKFADLTESSDVFNAAVEKLGDEFRVKGVKNQDQNKLAENIVLGMERLKNKTKCEFLVDSNELGKVPGVSPCAVNPVENGEILSKIQILESQLEKVLQSQNSLQQAVSRGLSQIIPKSGPSLSVPQSQNIPGITPRPRVPSFSTGTPTRSTSKKRSRQEGAGDNQPAAGGATAGGVAASGGAGGANKETWAVVANRTKPKRKPPTRGTSKVELTKSVVAPFDLFIANTDVMCEANDIKEALKKVAEQAPEDIRPDEQFEVIDAELMTKEIEGIRMRRKSWRVRVAWKYREYILKPDALPCGWTSRRYFPSRPKRTESDGGPAAKKPFQPSMSSGASSPLVQ